MRIKIEYIANFLGLDIKNPLVLADIAEIKELDGFIAFMKDNMKNTRLDFLNPLKSLTELKKMYLQEINRERLEGARSQSFKLALKFRELKPMLRELDGTLQTRNLAQNGVLCFSEFENSSFEKIGNLKRLIFLDDNFKLEEELEKVFFWIVYSGNKQHLLAQKSTNDTKAVQSVTDVLNLALSGNK